MALFRFACPAEGCGGEQTFRAGPNDVTGGPEAEYWETCANGHDLDNDEAAREQGELWALYAYGQTAEEVK